MSVASSHSHTGTDVSSSNGTAAAATAAAAAAANNNTAHIRRQRLGSVGDSVPASDSSEGTASETFEHQPHWAIRMDDHHHQHQHQHHHQQHHSHQQMGQMHQQRQSTYRLSGHGSSIGHDSMHGKDLDVLTVGHNGLTMMASSPANIDDDCGPQQEVHEERNDEEEDEEEAVSNSETGLDSLSLENSGVLSELERAQVESFFCGLGTEIFVSPSLANLYENCGQNDWRLVYTGVPVLLHDKGSTRSRSQPRVTLVLAERGTCFALWQDTVDQLSDYKIGGPAFHTMCLSSDRSKLIGFSFDSNQAALETWQTVEKLMADPANSASHNSGAGRKRGTPKQPKRPKAAPLPPKSQISAPCQFQHVTSVTATDAPRYFSLQAFVQSAAKHRSH